MDQYMYTGPPDLRSLLHPLWIVTWKHGCSCMALCMCPGQLISVPAPCLECVHASVHEFMSTQLPRYAPLPMHNLMETWVPVCGIVCLAQSPYFWTHTLVRMCTCISTWFMSTWLSMFAPCPMHSLVESWVSLYVSVFVYQSPKFCSNTLFRMCTCIRTWLYVHLTAHVYSTPYA